MRRLRSGVLVLLIAALGCEAKTPPEPRVVDLTAKDGVHLKATYFAAGKPGTNSERAWRQRVSMCSPWTTGDTGTAKARGHWSFR
jgi:hypothetical protein